MSTVIYVPVFIIEVVGDEDDGKVSSVVLPDPVENAGIATEKTISANGVEKDLDTVKINVRGISRERWKNRIDIYLVCIFFLKPEGI